MLHRPHHRNARRMGPRGRSPQHRSSVAQQARAGRWSCNPQPSSSIHDQPARGSRNPAGVPSTLAQQSAPFGTHHLRCRPHRFAAMSGRHSRLHTGHRHLTTASVLRQPYGFEGFVRVGVHLHTGLLAVADRERLARVEHTQRAGQWFSSERTGEGRLQLCRHP